MLVTNDAAREHRQARHDQRGFWLERLRRLPIGWTNSRAALGPRDGLNRKTGPEAALRAAAHRRSAAGGTRARW
jgi:hypothetical protein